eukprot:g3295.t1
MLFRADGFHYFRNQKADLGSALGKYVIAPGTRARIIDDARLSPDARQNGSVYLRVQGLRRASSGKERDPILLYLESKAEAEMWKQAIEYAILQRGSGGIGMGSVNNLEDSNALAIETSVIQNNGYIRERNEPAQAAGELNESLSVSVDTQLLHRIIFAAAPSLLGAGEDLPSDAILLESTRFHERGNASRERIDQKAKSFIQRFSDGDINSVDEFPCRIIAAAMITALTLWGKRLIPEEIFSLYSQAWHAAFSRGKQAQQEQGKFDITPDTVIGRTVQIELAAKVVDFLSPQRAEALKLVCAYLSKFCRLHRPWELGLRKPGKGENAHSNVIPTFSKILIYDATNEGNGPHPLRLAASALLKDFMRYGHELFPSADTIDETILFSEESEEEKEHEQRPASAGRSVLRNSLGAEKRQPRDPSLRVTFSAANEAGMGIIADAGDAVEENEAVDGNVQGLTVFKENSSRTFLDNAAAAADDDDDDDDATVYDGGVRDGRDSVLEQDQDDSNRKDEDVSIDAKLHELLASLQSIWNTSQSSDIRALGLSCASTKSPTELLELSTNMLGDLQEDLRKVSQSSELEVSKEDGSAAACAASLALSLLEETLYLRITLNHYGQEIIRETVKRDEAFQRQFDGDMGSELPRDGHVGISPGDRQPFSTKSASAIHSAMHVENEMDTDDVETLLLISQ